MYHFFVEETTSMNTWLVGFHRFPVSGFFSVPGFFGLGEILLANRASMDRNIRSFVQEPCSGPVIYSVFVPESFIPVFKSMFLRYSFRNFLQASKHLDQELPY